MAGLKTAQSYINSETKKKKSTKCFMQTHKAHHKLQKQNTHNKVFLLYFYVI